MYVPLSSPIVFVVLLDVYLKNYTPKYKENLYNLNDYFIIKQ